METLGSLIDKLTIVKLKQFHTSDCIRTNILNNQREDLVIEINEFINNPPKKLTFPANKVHPEYKFYAYQGSMGFLIDKLAEVNCNIWHEQEKVYEFELVPFDKKDSVIDSLAINFSNSRDIFP